MSKLPAIILLAFVVFSCQNEPVPVEAEETQVAEPSTTELIVDSNTALVRQQITSVPIPETLIFAGEEVPLDIPDVRERLERELLANTYRHSRTVLILKRLKRWRNFVENILVENGVHKDFIYMAIAESELNNNAKSPARALGMWQFMPGTAKEYGLEITSTIDQRKDPELATQAACQYLKDSYQSFEDWTLVAASYNMGKSGLRKKMKEQQVDSYFDLYLYSETSRYVFRILAFKIICENPEDYGFLLEDDSTMYAPFEYYEMDIEDDIENLNDFAISKGTNYKTLRLYNPWLNDARRYELNVPKGSSYKMRIPSNSKALSDTTQHQVRPDVQ